MAMNLHNNNYRNFLRHYPEVDDEAPLKKTHHRQQQLQTPHTLFHDQLQHHHSQFFFFLPSSAPFPPPPPPPPYLCTPLLPEHAGFLDGFYMDSHIVAAPVPRSLYPPQNIDDSFIDISVQAHNSEPGVDHVVCESYFFEEQQQQQLDPKFLHFKQQQQYDQDGKKIIGEGLTILNIVHGAAYDELHVGSGSSEGGIRIPGPFKVGEEEVVLPASLDEHDTSFVVIVSKPSN